VNSGLDNKDHFGGIDKMVSIGSKRKIDDIIYHIGASLKDIGKKWFCILKNKRC